MDTLSKYILDQIEIDTQMDRYIQDNQMEFIPELQIELEAIQKKIHALENKQRREKKKLQNTLI